MSNENYVPYGEEWKREISKLNKNTLIEIAARIGKEKEDLKEAADLRVQCRHYLMGVEPNLLSIEDALEILGYGRNGLGL
ncbi:MAG: hypothetical protein ACR2KZ_03495 [Segetibacter sp.]